MTVDQQYRREGEGSILSCVLDDMVLLYHRPSGQTHMVISPVPEILDALQDGDPASARDVLRRLSRLYDLGPANDALPEIAAHMANMAALGLIRPAS
ncbi:MAG: HPr-rel-A system PqqD family peptide chaperone [Sphingobium sp.]